MDLRAAHRPGGATRADVIRADVIGAILEQRLRPGTKLGEDEVGSIYGVSRTIVRAALQSLAHEGIVVIEKNRGAFVAHPSVAEAHEVFQARRLIEAETTERAAARCDAAAAAALAAHLDQERRAKRRGDESGAIRLSGEFHLMIARIADHGVYASFLGELVARSSLIILLYRRAVGHACNVDHHAALVEAIAARRGDEAVASMRRHLDEIESDLELVDTSMAVWPLTDVLGPTRRR
ncbi:GntR family transcriptional regulator [Siculibacillus lacustris]|uniref:GntR family transcriptional regulator n=1 Tax=Siculibacillus lacustris TaxID=1549641 RepID=A0A4V2KTV5_9HYPH|nr:GntR family transcriptional regulator [Siculibacillus lacustris]